MQTLANRRSSHEKAGLAMGLGAILLWSISAASIVFTGKRIGIWQSMGLAALATGLLQTVGHVVLGRSLRAILVPPPKFWLAIFLGYLFYLMLYAAGLATARTEVEIVGVGLMNFLWPVLAILFTTWLVPGERLRGRLIVAMGLSLAGVVLSNPPGRSSPGEASNPWPYALGALAAVAWALYCALVSRWRHWARNYAAGPLGFLLVGVAALGVCVWRGEWQTMDGVAWMGVLFIALGPWAGGYLLWELALHRVSGVTLGLMAAATPLLSTLNLIILFAFTSPGNISGSRKVLLLAASSLIGASVAVGSKKREM